MNNMLKVLIGVGVVGAVAATTYVVTKKVEANKAVEVVESSDISNDETIFKKIEKAAIKKVAKILAWVALHQQQIESVGAILSITAGVLSVANAVRDFRNGMNLQKQLNSICAYIDESKSLWNQYIALDAQNDNEVMEKLKKIHLDLGMLHELHERLCA